MAQSFLLTSEVRLEGVLQDCARSPDMVGLFNCLYGYDLKSPIEALLEDGESLDRCRQASTSEEAEQIGSFVEFVIAVLWCPYQKYEVIGRMDSTWIDRHSH